MISPEQQDRVVVVLVRARNPSNIGAAARAMHDFGFSRLRIVNEYPVPFAAAKSAVDAGSVLQAAQEYSTVAEAVADCSFVLGTTAVGERALQHRLYTLAEAAEPIADALAANSDTRIALLFGSEKTGLSNEELSHCHALLTIPMSQAPALSGAQRHLSMNLGQAVAVCLYGINQLEPAHPLPAPEMTASGADLDRVTTLLREVMEGGGYARRNPANAREASVRRLVLRMNLSASDSAVWTGVLRQTLYALQNKASSPSGTQAHAATSNTGAAVESDEL